MYDNFNELRYMCKEHICLYLEVKPIITFMGTNIVRMSFSKRLESFNKLINLEDRKSSLK